MKNYKRDMHGWGKRDDTINESKSCCIWSQNITEMKSSKFAVKTGANWKMELWEQKSLGMANSAADPDPLEKRN